MLTELVRLFMLSAVPLPGLTAAASLLPIAAAVFVKVGVQAKENGEGFHAMMTGVVTRLDTVRMA